MKNKFIYIFASLATLFMLSACESEEFVNPTANRSGITSLAAYFTSGDNSGKLAIDYKIDSSANVTDFVIPVPWYYPEESDNTTEQYMSAMKVVATIENNCTISPAITVLDLNKKNEFTFTNPDGSQRKITISGEMAKPSSCVIKAFNTEPGGLSGVIDEDTKTVSLVTTADLSEMKSEATISPHATISPDPAEVHNFNNGFQFTVTAANGINKAVYTVKKQIPAKIENGYRSGSELKMFENDMTTLGVTDANAVHPTLASIGSYVILNLGTGAAPQYFKKATGSRVGTINIGSANPNGAITSDCAGNIIMCNYAASGKTLKIYKTNDVTTAPTEFISYNNNLGINVGSRLHVQGDLNGNAVITATCENSNSYIRWIVKNGKPDEAKVVGMTGIASSWNSYDNIAKVINRSADGNSGVFVDYYNGGACPLYYAADGKAATQLLSANSNTDLDYGFNTAPIDTRDFNGSKYLALFEMGYWPDWGMSGTIYLYDATNPSSITGNTNTSSALKYKYKVSDLFGSVGYAADGRFGDVLMTPSADGYFMYIFYASNTHLSFGGIQIDCIAK
jgi:hypothetical protein